MQPTNNLRFVERETKVQPFDCLYPTVTVVRVLQQWWSSNPDSREDWLMKANGEWIDVQLEQEGK